MKHTKRMLCFTLGMITAIATCGCQSQDLPKVNEAASFTETISETTIPMSEELSAATEEPAIEILADIQIPGETEPIFPVHKPPKPAAPGQPDSGPKPTETNPAETEPAETKPVKTEPAVTEPAETEPAQHKHIYTETVSREATCTSSGKLTYLCSCGHSYLKDIPQKQHSYTSQTVAATCSAEGYTMYTCRNCNHSYISSRTSARGHSWGEWKVTQEATITSVGEKRRSCSFCNESETAEIEKIPHAHIYTEKITVPSKCEEAGLKACSCSCGEFYTKTIPAAGHSWSNWKRTKEETENEPGLKERSCESCGKKEYMEIPKVEHTHSMIHIVTKPTCTAEGYTTHKCSICPYTYTDTKVAAKGHSFGDWQTVLEPTEAADGLAKRNCSSCSASESKVLEKLPAPHKHSYTTAETVAATCTTEGYTKKVCSCGHVLTETIPASHKWESRHQDEIGHWEVYIVCHCGWRCSADGDYTVAFANHVNSVDPETKYDHSYYDTSEWVVDTPAKDWHVCTECGTTK